MNAPKSGVQHVVCVLSEAQRLGLGQQLERLRQPEVKLVFQDSPQLALDQIGELRPPLVLVGMSLDEMEGLEFLALLMRRHADFSGKVIVIPDEGDPFPPMAQYRDVASGKSVTQETTIAQVLSWIEALAPAPATAAAPSATPAPAAQPAPAPAAKPAPAPAAKPAPAPAARPAPAPAAKPAPAPAAKPAPVPAVAAKPAAVPAVAAKPAPAPAAKPAAVPAAAAKPAPAPAAKPAPVPAVAAKPAPLPAVAAKPAPLPAAEPAAAAEPDVAAESGAEPLIPEAPPAAEPPPRAVAAAPPPAEPVIDSSKPNTPAAGAADLPARKWWLLLAALAALAVVILLVVVLAGQSREPDPAAPRTSGAPSAPPREAVAASIPPSTAQAKPLPSFEELTTLPLRFDRKSTEGIVTEPGELDGLVSSLSRAMQERPKARLEVGGHTSKEGPEYLHGRLGERRALDAKRRLVERGIAEHRIVLNNYEAARPLPSAGGGDELDGSRRVTVRLID
jgi:outer membrane protein OmpA-like peptidoglycan-associated protein/CheY-like chemotaxis protein